MAFEASTLLLVSIITERYQLLPPPLSSVSNHHQRTPCHDANPADRNTELASEALTCLSRPSEAKQAAKPWLRHSVKITADVMVVVRMMMMMNISMMLSLWQRPLQFLIEQIGCLQLHHVAVHHDEDCDHGVVRTHMFGPAARC